MPSVDAVVCCFKRSSCNILPSALRRSVQPASGTQHARIIFCFTTYGHTNSPNDVFFVELPTRFFARTAGAGRQPRSKYAVVYVRSGGAACARSCTLPAALLEDSALWQVIQGVSHPSTESHHSHSSSLQCVGRGGCAAERLYISAAHIADQLVLKLMSCATYAA